MPTDKFIAAYLKAVMSGTTREELSKQIGISPDSIYQRIYDMHNKGVDKKMFPHLPTTGRQSFLDRVQAAVNDFKKTNGGQAAVVAAATTPAVKAVRKGKPPAEKPAAPPVTVDPPVGDDGDLDPSAALERMLDGGDIPF